MGEDFAVAAGKAGDPGRTAADNRLFVSGCLWVLRSAAHWCDLPERVIRPFNLRDVVKLP